MTSSWYHHDIIMTSLLPLLLVYYYTIIALLLFIITYAIITYYYNFIITYYYIIITISLHHYYVMIALLLLMGNHVIMILLLRVMQKGFLYYYVFLHHYYIINTAGSIITDYYIFWSPETCRRCINQRFAFKMLVFRVWPRYSTWTIREQQSCTQKTRLKVAKYDESYTIFSLLLIWTYGLVVNVSSSESGDMGATPDECWNPLLLLGLLRGTEPVRALTPAIFILLPVCSV